MTIQQHASFDSSAAELNATSKLVKAWESKNAKNAAKAGGISMMALSLAACGGSSTTTTATDTTTDTTTTVDAAQSFVATTGIDQMVGGSGNDTFFTIATGTTASAQPGDSFTGGDGDDLLAITATGTAAATVAGLTLSGVETIRVSDTNTGGTDINLAGNTGVTKLMAFGSANTGDTTTFLNVGSVAELELSNTSSTGGVTLNYTTGASAGTTTQAINLVTAASTGDTIIAGVEVFNVTSSGTSTLDLVAAAGTTVSVVAADATTMVLDNALNTALTSVTAAGSAGAVTMEVDFSTVEMAIVGGDGDDVFDLSAGAMGTNDSLDGGAGDADKILFQSTAAAPATADIAAAAAVISNVEVLELEADDGANDTAFTVDMDNFEGVTSVLLDANDVSAANAFDLDDINATQMAAITVQVAAGGATVNLDAKDGTGFTDQATISAGLASTAGTLTVQDDNGNIEKLTVNLTGNADQTLAIAAADFAGSASGQGSVTVTGGAAGRTLTMSNSLTADTIDLSGVASNVTLSLGATNHTVTGGSGDDVIDFGANFTNLDSFDGGLGSDTVKIAASGSIAQPGTLTSVEKLELAASATSTIAATSFTGMTDVVLSNAAGLDGQVVTLQSLTGITSITHDVANAAAADGADDANGVTITSGFTGTADALTLNIDNAGTNAGATVMGAVSLAGLENLTISVTGGDDNDSATVGGITATGLNTVTVTSTGFTSDASSIVLGSISEGGTDTMESFTAAGSVQGVNVTLADMGAASTIVGSNDVDVIILTGSTGDDITLNSGDGADQITLASGTDRVSVTTGTGDTDIFFATGDDHSITLGTGANVLDFDAAGDSAETTGVTVTGFGADDDIRMDALADTAVNIVSAQTTAINSNLNDTDTTVFTLNSSVADAVIDGVDATTAIADYTDVADGGDVELFLELVFGGNAAGGSGTVIVNDGTNSYMYAMTISAAEEVTALDLVLTINDYVVNGATDVIL